METWIERPVPAEVDRTQGPVTVPPMDDYNRELVANVHPPTHRNPTPTGRYNLVVIGGGTAGLVAAVGAAGLGGKVALVERHLLGGDCLNTGCVPSKAIIRTARVVGELGRAREFGVNVPPGATVDFGAVMARMRRVRAAISHEDSAARMAKVGVELYLGSARFTGPTTVEVEYQGERQTLTFAKAVIAAGSSARTLDVPGAAATGYLTNATLFELTALPKRLAVVGAGPIGAEMAQTFARLGAQVTVVEQGTQLLGREDADAAQVVRAALARDGVQFAFEAEVTELRRSPTGKVIVYRQPGGDHTLEVDEILVSIGRTPNVQGLGLEAAGVESTARGITVDDTLRTTNPNVYAAGDIASRYQFTHLADATARIVVQNALFPGPKRKVSDLVVPWTTYTDPEVAHTGLNAEQAAAQGLRVTTFVQPLSGVDRARTDGAEEGFVKVYVKAGTDKIAGATIVAPHAGELIGEITTAIVGGVGLQKLAQVIHPYPTQADAIRKVADQYNRTRLTPTVKRIFRWWLARQR